MSAWNGRWLLAGSMLVLAACATIVGLDPADPLEKAGDDDDDEAEAGRTSSSSSSSGSGARDAAPDTTRPPRPCTGDGECAEADAGKCSGANVCVESCFGIRATCFSDEKCCYGFRCVPRDGGSTSWCQPP